MKIDVLARLNRDADIVPWLEQASQGDRHNLGLKVLLAKQYVQARRLAQAEKLYQSLADDSPTVDVYRGLFRLAPGRTQARATLQTLRLLDKTLEQAAKTKGPPGTGLAASQGDGRRPARRRRAGQGPGRTAFKPGDLAAKTP